jgi:hypothetical protein
MNNRSKIWPVVLLWYTLLLPPQVAFDVGGISLYFYRIAILLAIPTVFSARIKLAAADALIATSAIVTVISVCWNQGFAFGMAHGAPIAVDLMGSYFIARASIRNVDDLRKVLLYLAPGLFLAGVTVMVESITHHFIIKPLADAYFGQRAVLGTRLEEYQPRLGLTRGLGPFAHQILAGLCLSLALPLYWAAREEKKNGTLRLLGILAGLMAVFSVSSTAFISLAVSAALLIYDTLARHTRAIRWNVLISLIAAGLFVIQIGFPGGILKFGIRFAMEGGSGWYRYAEWQYGLISIAQHPLLGIGLADYERPGWMITPSVDSEWLLLAIDFGYIACLSKFFMVMLVVTKAGQASQLMPVADGRLLRAVGFALANLGLAGFMVAIFGAAQNWFPILMGAAISASQATFRAQHSPSPTDPADTSTIPHHG